MKLGIVIGQTELAAVRRRQHPQCWVCGKSHPAGIHLSFVSNPDGGVSALFDCSARWEGYPGRVHGGAIAALLDGAMTNCLFAQGMAAFTAELSVRYREAVITGRPGHVRAWLVRSSPRLHELRAELSQAGRVKAVATGKFLPLSPTEAMEASHG